MSAGMSCLVCRARALSYGQLAVSVTVAAVMSLLNSDSFAFSTILVGSEKTREGFNIFVGPSSHRGSSTNQQHLLFPGAISLNYPQILQYPNKFLKNILTSSQMPEASCTSWSGVLFERYIWPSHVFPEAATILSGGKYDSNSTELPSHSPRMRSVNLVCSPPLG